MYLSKDAIQFLKKLPDDEKRVTIAIPTDQNYALDSSVFDDAKEYASCPQTHANSLEEVNEKNCLADVSATIKIRNKAYCKTRKFIARMHNWVSLTQH